MKGYYLVNVQTEKDSNRLEDALKYISLTTWSDATALDGVSGLGTWTRESFEHFSIDSFEMVVLFEADNVTEFWYMSESHTIKHMSDDDKRSFLEKYGLPYIPSDMELYYKVMQLLDEIALDDIKYNLTNEQMRPRFDDIAQLISYSEEDEEDYIKTIADANDCGDCATLINVMYGLKKNFLNGQRIRVDGKPLNI